MDSSHCVCIILLLLTSRSWSIEEGAFLKIPCYYEKSNEPWLGNDAVNKNKAWLIKSHSPEQDVDPAAFEGLTFIFKEEVLPNINKVYQLQASPVNFMIFLKENPEDLYCEIKPYFTDNIQVLWPGIPATHDMPDSWHIVSVQHKRNTFHLTVFFFKLSEDSKAAADKHHVLATLMVSTQTPHVYGRLTGSVLLDCAFAVDHKADVLVTWSFQGKLKSNAKLVSYTGSTRKLQYFSKQVLLQMEEFQNGKVSLLVNNLTMANEGQFICTISVISLYADQMIHLKIRESPRVTLNSDSVILKEGQEQKFVCDASNYYPLDVNIEWLRVEQYGRLMPTLLTNVVYSSHKNNRDGTYSLSSFFMYRASLRDNGVTFICRVEHESLQEPLKRSVRVHVLESTEWTWNLEVPALVIILAVITILGLLYLRKIYLTAKNSRKSKPY